MNTLTAVNVAEAVLFGGIAFCIALFIVGFIKDSIRVGIAAGVVTAVIVAVVDLATHYYYTAGGAP